MKPDYKELWSELSREFVLLEAENEKLRAALKPFADSYTNEEFEYSPVIFKSSELRAAAEVIRDETE